MEKAIKKAIEGGWNNKPFISSFCEEGDKDIFHVHYDTILLDPLFWQSLGKAMGWINSMPSRYEYNDDIPEWKHKWFSFIDHLAEGKSAESFFEELLT